MFRLNISHNIYALIAVTVWSFHVSAQEVIPHKIERFVSEDFSIVSFQEKLHMIYGSDVALKLYSDRRSLIGRHQQYRIKIAGYFVHDAFLKVNTLQDGQTTVAYPKLEFTSLELPQKDIPATRQNNTYFNDLFREIYNTGFEWSITNKKPTLIWFIEGQTEDDHLEIITDLSGRELYRTTKRLYHHRDTTVAVNTFQPDPITYSNEEHGFSLEDNDDQASDRLNELMVMDSIAVRWDSTNIHWELRSDFAKAEDIFAPFILPPTSTDGNFLFDRSQDGFEYVNAFFHLNKQHTHLEELGYDSLVNYPIPFDGHGSTLEQSFFDPITQTKGQLVFGEGGVDDAEDADVVIHEYGHAISYDIAPGTALGGERLAVEEGLCDFLAIGYSREYSDYQRDLIFNWDGHNQFWSGRELTYSRTYPTDLQGDLYLDAPMWASALADVHDYYGREISESLLLTSMYSYFIDMSMLEAAQLYLQADTLLYNASHSAIISAMFCQRGLLPDCLDTLPTDAPPTEPYLANQGDFSVNKGPLTIYPNGHRDISVDLFNIEGALVLSHTFENQQIAYELPFVSIPQGIYIVRISTSTGSFSDKVLKLIPQ